MGQRADQLGGRSWPDDGDRAVSGPAVDPAPAEGAETEVLREEIEHTRAEMSETIDAIQRKLNPETIVDQVKEAAREAAEQAVEHAKEAVREATVGKAEDVVRTVTHAAQDVMQNAGESADDARFTLIQTIKQNPIPAALAGFGLAWLWMNREQRPASSGMNGGRYAGATASYGGTTRFTPASTTPSPRSPAPAPRAEGGRTLSAPQAWEQNWSQSSGGATSGTTTRPDQGQGAVGETIDRAKDMAGDIADQAQETLGQAADRVQSVARTAGGRAGDMGSDLMDMVRANPIPAALAGVSLAWLYLNRPSGGAQTSSQRYGYQPYSYPYGQPNDRTERLGEGAIQRAQETADQVVDQVQSTAGQVVDQVQSTAGQVVDQVQSTAGQVAGQARDTVGQVTGQAQEQAMRARNGVEEMLQDNPLAVGVIALALGAAAGLTVPQTRQEHRLLGEARDTLVERAQEVAQETMEKVQHVAQEMQSTAKEEASNQGLTQ